MKKVIVQLGDAPPLEPEPHTGYTAQTVIDAAMALDPAQIYVVDSSSSNAMGPSLDLIAQETGGSVLRAPTPAQVAAAVAAAIDEALRNPFAWANGPYIATTGKSIWLDASGSYDPEGGSLTFEWDVDNDGVFDITSLTRKVSYTFSAPYDGLVVLRITNGSGRHGLGTAYVNISTDGDGIPSELDNCPEVSNHDQSDYDGDGVGDACDGSAGYPTGDKPGVREKSKDNDKDGVLDGVDQCPATSLGQKVDPRTGCSIAQLCPCSGPRASTSGWRDHGSYVSCVAKTADNWVTSGFIGSLEKDAIVSGAARSSCGAR